MRCPECDYDGPTFPRKGTHLRKRVTKDGRIWRLHQCQNCRHRFVSVQSVIEGSQAARWEAVFDPPTLPLTGSNDTSEDED